MQPHQRPAGAHAAKMGGVHQLEENKWNIIIFYHVDLVLPDFRGLFFLRNPTTLVVLSMTRRVCGFNHSPSGLHSDHQPTFLVLENPFLFCEWPRIPPNYSIFVHAFACMISLAFAHRYLCIHVVFHMHMVIEPLTYTRAFLHIYIYRYVYICIYICKYI